MEVLPSGPDFSGTFRPASSRPAGRPVQRFSVKELKNGRPGGFLKPASAEPRPDELAKLEKIKRAAVDYESFFVQKMIEAMRLSPLAEVPGGRVYLELAEKSLAGHLAQAGGLGLAEKIITQVARQEGLEAPLSQRPDILGPGREIRLPASHMIKPLLRPGPA